MFTPIPLLAPFSRPLRPPRPGFGNRFDFRPGRPPMNGARECARRLRQAAKAKAKQENDRG